MHGGRADLPPHLRGRAFTGRIVRPMSRSKGIGGRRKGHEGRVTRNLSHPLGKAPRLSPPG